MKELVIISGKGGTGKTSITACFASLANNKVMVDCDVDAADLHLILKPEIQVRNDFFGGKEAKINRSKCIECGRCIELCRFEAISNDFVVNEVKCEGCGLCYRVCPSNAIDFEKKLSGEWYGSNTRFGKLVHAKLGVAEENSGKLVSKIRSYAKDLAERLNLDFIIVDGSPGVGCPVIASITGTSLALIVVEPTLSGLHDFERVYQLTKHFNIPTCICINKEDLNKSLSKKINDFCNKNNLDVVGSIPYTKDFTLAQIKEKTLVEFCDTKITQKIKTMWSKIENKLLGE
jgi:MinD superfamily P-loop ATPase